MGLLTLTCAAWLVPAEAGASQTAIGLVKEGETWGRYPELDQQAINAATSAFMSTRRFDVTERAELSKIFAEKSLRDILGDESGNLFDLRGLDLIGFVSYTIETPDSRAPPVYVLSVRVASVGTGEVFGTFDSVRMSAFPATTIALAGDLLSANLREAFPPHGIIVKVIDKKTVVVDLGAFTGIEEGDRLVMFREGEPIIHPLTGEQLPGQEIEIGSLKVQSVGERIATCRVRRSKEPIEVAVQVRYESKTSRLEELVPKSAKRLLQGRWRTKVLRSLRDDS
ncbi:MAG: hypothetical protein AAGN46_07705 [Acidobacteriota bacterium]